ncbi:YdcF family protein [Stenotrophomonas sp. 22385]|uniref:YdcF family protein n=1 Tax=Stenotrophomonas sp. 22385 TaxID=3453915 RepID=UPI003F86B65E
MARGMTRRARVGLGGWLWRLCTLLAAWLLCVTAWIVWVGERDQAAKADAIIVLGAAAYDAKPSPVFEERIRHGLDLYRQGYAPLLIFTGGYGGTGARFSESQVARRYALKQGVPDDAILIETASRTTRQNLVEARLLMDQHRLRRVIIVSDPLHMARALRLARELGIDALASSTPSTRFRSFHTSWKFLAQEIYFFHRDMFPSANGS